jgi:hypothetical protein
MSLSFEHHHSSLSVGQRASPKRHRTALSFDEKANAIANYGNAPTESSSKNGTND